MIGNILASTTIINQAPRPLLISDNRTDPLIFTSYLLNPKVRYFIRPQCYTCSVKQKFDFESRLDKIGEGFSNVFLYPYPSEKLLKTIKEEQKYTIKSLVSEPKRIVLGRLEKS